MTTPNKSVFLAYVPFTGLGLYGGFRGNRWLRNRIKIFKQFVIPSLINQTDQDFAIWVGWRPEERTNKHVIDLKKWLDKVCPGKAVFTFGGLCFWDDKFSDDIERGRLAEHLHYTMPELFDVLGQADEVIMLIQPSDDLYEKHAIRRMKDAFASDPSLQAVTYTHGFHVNYLNKEIHPYIPTTNPPFFAYRMPKDVFTDPHKHMEWTGPYKSHEYIGDKMKLWKIPGPGFMVGSHTENISTHSNHPFIKMDVNFRPEDKDFILGEFGILSAPNLELPKSLRKWVMRKLPHGWQKKFRYLMGESAFGRFYSFIRN